MGTHGPIPIDSDQQGNATEYVLDGVLVDVDNRPADSEGYQSRRLGSPERQDRMEQGCTDIFGIAIESTHDADYIESHIRQCYPD